METAQHEIRPTHPGAVVLDRYELVRQLGAGGFGSVWLANDVRLERPVAVKCIPVRDASHAAAERAEREALAAARLSHPAVVSLYEAGRDANAVYLVSELVRGATLGALLADGALSDRDVLLIGMALCDALAHAHSRGVVHRDVKPGNVLVPETADEGVVAKLTDFGIARMTGDDALTATGDVVGTLAYMAPEQAEGRGATAASDLYSLGLVLYEALAGVNPIRQATPAATARQVGMQLPSLRRMRRDLPRALCAAVDASVLADSALRGSIDSLRLALAENLPDVTDDPGVVEPGRWATKYGSQPHSITQRWRRDRTEEFDADDDAPARTLTFSGYVHTPIPARLAHAAATAALTPLLLSLVATKPPVTPAVAAAIAGATTALLPRIGWLITAAALAGWIGSEEGKTGVILAAAAAPLPILIPWRPAWWSSPGLAIGLGYLVVPAAWPALAGQARGWWTRAVLGAAGFWWLALVEVVLHKHLLLGPASDIRDLVTTKWLLIAPVWALAAAVLPLLVRGRNVGADLLGACAWAVALGLGTNAAAHAAGAGSPRGIVGASALAALIAVLGQALRKH